MLTPHFEFKDAQPRWNKAWDKAGVFTPDAESSKTPFVITMPPPNVTGILHVGHVLGDSVQDLLIRWKRMCGYNTLFVPGTDHAGIGTQKVVEDDLRKRGIEPKNLSRDQLLEHAWEWKDKHHRHIVSQLKNLGCSLDWTREAFTFDEERSRAVRDVFVRLYEKSLIYQGNYIVNWCPSCATAISDEEVEHIEKDSHLYWIRYATTDGDFATVATTRPETMLGDTAVAISPDDAEKQRFLKTKAVLPLVGRELPFVADGAVDPEFGSGFVKVTPAHDPNDFEIGQRHNLDHIVVIDREGKMTDAAGAGFAGKDRFEARKAVLKALEKEGALVKVEPYRHSVGEHDRCHTIIEPLLSREWFVKMEPLAKPAIDVVDNREVEFYPPRWRNVYLSWMNNIRDWCISRQLWWGHRIPVWYCSDGHITVTLDDPDVCGKCGDKTLTQDDSVLDTWFSSWLWTFSPLGWPKKTRDLEVFHPTDVLVTGSEIIFFWVARMIMASLEFVGELPFRHVFLTGIVRDGQGRKMSKSLGNSPDPLDVIDRYGTDAFRFTLIMVSPPGHDVFFAEDKLEMGRNFINKIWQASRFVLGAYEKEDAVEREEIASGACAHADDDMRIASQSDLAWEDRWILSALDRCAKDVDEKLGGWRLNDAAVRVYDFFWGDFCDWYLELAKIRLYGEGDKRQVLSTLLFTLGESLKLLHPFMPYVTEELWSQLPMSKDLLIEADFPRQLGLDDAEIDEEMMAFRDLVTATRNIRALYAVKPSTEIELLIKTPDASSAFFDKTANGLKQLTRAGRLEYGPNIEKQKGSASTPVGPFEVVVPLTGVADIASEVERLEKEKQKIGRDLVGVQKKLANKNFVEKAKEAVVTKARERHDALQSELSKIEESLDIIVKNQ